MSRGGRKLTTSSMKPKKTIGKKACGCINHEIFCHQSSNISLRSRTHFERRNAYQELLRRRLVDRRVSYICTGCLDYGRRKISEGHVVKGTTYEIVSGEVVDITHATADGPTSSQPAMDDIDVDVVNVVIADEIAELEVANDAAPEVMNIDEDTAGETLQPVTDDTESYGTAAMTHMTDQVALDSDAGDEATEEGMDLDRTMDTGGTPIKDADANPSLTTAAEEVRGMTARLRKFQSWSCLNDDLKDSLCELSLVLGTLIRKELDNERFQMADQCRDFSSLASIKPREWYQQRNPLLTSFLHECTGVSPHTEKKKKLDSAIHAVEQIMYAKNNNIVTPFALQRNIIIYLVSHSKIITSICGSWEPSGSYTKVNKILKSPSPPLTIAGNNDIVVTFDNEQKVGRHTGRIREGSLQSISIITTVAVIETKPSTDYQFQPYKRIDLNSIETIRSVNTMESRFLEIIRIYRHKFVDEMIKSVYDEQFQNDVDFIVDAVDLAVMNEGKYVCSCGHMEDSIFEICPNCSENTSFFHHGFDKYFRTEYLNS